MVSGPWKLWDSIGNKKDIPEQPINPMELMLAAGATFVARGYSTRIDHLNLT